MLKTNKMYRKSLLFGKIILMKYTELERKPSMVNTGIRINNRDTLKKAKSIQI